MSNRMLLLIGSLLLASPACNETGVPEPCSEATWDASLRVVVLELDGTPTCLASVVADRWVLSAHHCIQPEGAETPLSPSTLAIRTNDGRRIAITRVETVGGPYETLGQLAERDIALLRTATPPSTSLDPLPFSIEGMHSFCVVRNDDPPLPSAVQVRAVESHTIYTHGQTCGGDSGGPLLDETGAIVGVTSWRTSDDCDEGTSAFVRLAPHREWIDSILIEH